MPTTATTTEQSGIDLIWGAKAIAEAINVNEQRARYYLRQGTIPARKVGDLWVADKATLREFFVAA